MATYFILESGTIEGMRTVRDAPKRSEGILAAGERMGVRVVEWFHTVAPFDFLMKVEAPTEEAVAAFVMAINAGGNVTAKYYKAFTAEEWKQIVARLP